MTARTADRASVVALKAKFDQFLPHLDERRRRLYLASEGAALGHGGISLVAAVSGASTATITRGISELSKHPLPTGRVRAPGAGLGAERIPDRGLDLLGEGQHLGMGALDAPTAEHRHLLGASTSCISRASSWSPGRTVGRSSGIASPAPPSGESCLAIRRTGPPPTPRADRPRAGSPSAPPWASAWVRRTLPSSDCTPRKAGLDVSPGITPCRSRCLESARPVR